MLIVHGGRAAGAWAWAGSGPSRSNTRGRGLTGASTWKWIYRQACGRHTAAHDTYSSAPVAKPGSNDPPMNGGQVRDTLFCRQGPSGMLQVAGYHPRQVNDLRRRIAAELDAGGSAGPLIENATFRRRRHGLRYDIDGVDWFLGQFLRLPGHDEPGGIAEDPWGDLPVARLAQRTSEKYAFEVQCDSAWRDFG
jgi:hypothetical protein